MSIERGSGLSDLLVAPGQAGNVVGIDPHKHRLSAGVLSPAGRLVAVEHFRVSGSGHRALVAWAQQFGPVARWGIEGAGGWGRHTAMFLIARGADVRDVCPTRTAGSDRPRQRGKSDELDCERVARVTLGHPLLPRAFKRAGDDQGVDETHELLRLWPNQRVSLVASRQHLVNEAGALLDELDLEIRRQLPARSAVRPRLTALARLAPPSHADRLTGLRLELLADYHAQIRELDRRERAVVAELARLIAAAGSTLGELCGLSVRSVAGLLVEVGDPRRFTQAGFARFNATAPLAASTAEGPGEPVRHRYNPGGNRRVNHILHMMAVTQVRCEPRAQALTATARARGHTRAEARRVLKRNLSNIVYRRMIHDLHHHPAPAPPGRLTAPGRDDLT